MKNISFRKTLKIPENDEKSWKTLKFLQKTLGIPDNDIEEHQICNRKHFPLENIKDSRKIVKTQRWKMYKMHKKSRRVRRVTPRFL